MAQQIARRLKLSRFYQDVLCRLIDQHLRPLFLYQHHQKGQLTSNGETRFCEDCHSFGTALLFHATNDMLGKTNKTAGMEDTLTFFHRLHTLLSEYRNLLETPSLINGDDLQTIFGLTPSSYFQEVLFAVQSAPFHGSIKTREEALILAEEYISAHPPASIK